MRPIADLSPHHLTHQLRHAQERLMKITQLETYFLSCPLPQPVHTSTHTIRQVSEVIVQLSTDAGLVGIGEAHGPFLLRQGQEGLQVVSDILRHITPLVLGADPFDVERIWQELFGLRCDAGVNRSIELDLLPARRRRVDTEEGRQIFVDEDLVRTQ
jgi:hypothetical protein